MVVEPYHRYSNEAKKDNCYFERNVCLSMKNCKLNKSKFHPLEGVDLFKITQRLKRVSIYLPLGYERVHQPLREVADAPFHIQGGDICY